MERVVMNDTDKSKEQLICELDALRQRVVELETAATDLQTREAKTQAMLALAVEGMVTIDARGIIQTVNQTAARLFGYSVEDMIGQNVTLLMSEPYKREHNGYLRRFHETGKSRIIGLRREVEGQRKDGTTFPLELTVREVIINDQPLFTGIFHDITERKRTENALRQMNNKYRTLFEESKDPSFISIREGTILDVNQAHLDLSGYTKDEIVGNNASNLYANPADWDRFRREIEHRGTVKNYEVKYRKKDGTVIDCLLTARVWRARDGCLWDVTCL